MEFLELLAWLADQEQKTQDQEALQAFAIQIQQQQDALNSQHLWLLGITIIGISLAIGMFAQFWIDERKVKKLASRVADLEKKSEKS